MQRHKMSKEDEINEGKTNYENPNYVQKLH